MDTSLKHTALTQTAAECRRITESGRRHGRIPIESIARNAAEYCGFSESMGYPFESPDAFDRLLLPAESALRKAAVIANPLCADFSIMRTTPVNGMLTSLAVNYNRGNKDVRLYELGNIYLPEPLAHSGFWEERLQFTLGMYGEGDFYTMKGVIEMFLFQAGMRKKPGYDPGAEKPFLHPGRQADIIYNGTKIGFLGEIYPAAAQNYAVNDRVYAAVMDMPCIRAMSGFTPSYTPIAKFPPLTRDISMVCPNRMLAGDIEKIIESAGGSYLEDIRLTDIYEGNQIKIGFKSMTYQITLRAPDRALDDETAEEQMKQIVKALEEKGVELRK